MRILVVVALLLSAPAVARADDGGDQAAREAQAKQYFEAGKQAAAKGQYPVAIVAFEEAYRLDSRASVVYALAYSYRQQWVIDQDPAKLKRAVALFREYLGKPGNDKKDRAVEYLGQLEPELARVEAEQRQAGKGPVAEAQAARRTTLIVYARVDGAEVALDGAAPVEAPLVAETSAGKHTVRVTAAGYAPAELEAVAVEGQAVSVEVPLEPLPAELTIRAPAGAKVAVGGKVVGRGGQALTLPAGRHRVTVVARGRYAWERDLELTRGGSLTVDAPLEVTTQRKVAWWFLGGSGALLVAGGVSTALALSAQGDAETLEQRRRELGDLSPAELADYNDALDRRDAWRTAALVLLGGAAAAAGTGLVLFTMDTPRVDTGWPAGVGVALKGEW